MRIILVLIGLTLSASSSISLGNTEDVERYGPDTDIDQLADVQREAAARHRETADINNYVKDKPRPEFTYTVDQVHHGPHRSHDDKLQKVVVKAQSAATSPMFHETVPAVQGMPRVAARVQHHDKHSPADKASSMADIYFLAYNKEEKRKFDDTGQNNIARQKEDTPITSSPTTTAPPPQSAGQSGGKPGSHVPVTDNSGPILIALMHDLDPFVYTAVIAGCSVAGLVGLVIAGVCWYKLRKNMKAASDVDYPAYGVTGPSQEKVGSPGDRKLAQSAQMYHYQHQKQQMIAMEKANSDMNKDGSEVDSDEENEEGDYTVFECPGLAPTGEMEVKNPLFNEDTPATPSVTDLSHSQ